MPILVIVRVLQTVQVVVVVLVLQLVWVIAQMRVLVVQQRV